MKRLSHILAALAVTLLATGCGLINHDKDNEKRMVLFYIAATESSLSPYAETNIDQMVSGYIPSVDSKDQELLVFFQNKTTDATLRRYFTNHANQVAYEEIKSFGSDFNACTPEGLREVLEAAEEECKPKYRSLLFSSHGTGWMPEGYFNNSTDQAASGSHVFKTKAGEDQIRSLSRLQAVSSVGYDSPSGNEIDIQDFAKVAGKWHWETIIFDCCYMGSVEVAYQIKDICDYMIASPTEILITGFPYRIILNELFNNPGKSGVEYIATKYYELYMAEQGIYQSGCIVSVDCSLMEPFAQVCADIVKDAGSRIAEVDRDAVQKYCYPSIVKDGKDYFFDLAHYFEQFCTEEQYAQFSAALDQATVYKNSTEEFLRLKIEHYCGLSTYIPKASYKNLNAYYKTLAWNQKINILQ